MTADTASGAADGRRLELVTADGPWGGPLCRYRGGEVRCLRGGHVCGLLMEAHPVHGITMGVPGTITPLIDLWLDERRLPAHMRAVPRQAKP